MTWVFTRDWPIIFGGKPYFSAPAFIPITFELTVLFAAVGMVVTFYVICGMGPGIINPTLDDRITDDKFCIAFSTNCVTVFTFYLNILHINIVLPTKYLKIQLCSPQSRQPMLHVRIP